MTLKTYATLLKIILYLLLYIHVVACGWWIIVGYNSNYVYYKLKNGIPGHDYCLYVDYTNEIYKIEGTDTPAPCDDRDTKWGSGPTFGEDDWTRYTATDKPFGYAWFTAGA